MSAGQNPVAKKLGITIRKLRDEAGMTQATLAEKADLKPNFIGEIERAEKVPSIDTVIRIARGLGVTGEKLLGHAKL